jgi:hypothetical protein
MTDSRIGKSAGGKKKSAGKSARLNARSDSDARKSRHLSDREVTQNRTLTDDERLDEFRRSFYQSVLPDIPDIPGYHVCWLTTNNPRDSIPGRIRLGYSPIKASDVPGWEYASLKTGEYAGCIGVNEMIAFKLPTHLYEAYMYEAHHAQPMMEERKLASVIDVIREEAARAAKSGARGVKITLEGGMEELAEERQPPSFTHTLTTTEAPRRN